MQISYDASIFVTELYSKVGVQITCVICDKKIFSVEVYLKKITE